MATNPGSWSSPSLRSARTPTLGSTASGTSYASAQGSMPSNHRITAIDSPPSTREKEEQSNSTSESSPTSLKTPSSPSFSHKFESTATGSPYPSLPPGSMVTMGRGTSSSRSPKSSSSPDQAPGSLPARLNSSIGSSSQKTPELAHSTTTSSVSAQSALSSETDTSLQFSYDLSSSNIILPRGTIRPVTVHANVTPSANRSISPLQQFPQHPRPASLSSAELATKSEKTRKIKKKNGSSLPAPPPSSSIASVPMAEGTMQMAEAITNRWPDALYQGWMKKRNKGKESTAKKRYLVIKTNCMEYYSDPESLIPKGCIKFEDIAIQFNETLRVYAKEKVWEFMAESERDLTRWHVAFRAVLSSINK